MRRKHASIRNNSGQSTDSSSSKFKRQRKQTAALVVQSLWNNNSNSSSTGGTHNNAETAAPPKLTNMGRKSTAQPRPKLNVAPKGIGPVVNPNDNDVLCGRGGRINSHAGNVQFRDIIASKKKEYLAPTTKKLEKAHIAAAIVNDIRHMDPPGRFLKEDAATKEWWDIGDAKAIKKVGQALREDAPEIRGDIEGDESSGSEKESSSPKNKGQNSPKARSKSPKSRSKSPKSNVKQPPMPAGTGPWNQPAGSTPAYAQQQQDHQGMPPPAFLYNTGGGIPVQLNSTGVAVQQQPPNSFYSLPNQLYQGAMGSAMSVGKGMQGVSKQAMEALATPDAGMRAAPPMDVAFDRPFAPPMTANGSLLSSGNTMSTISALSDPVSSNFGLDGNSRNAGHNQRMPSSASLRLSQLNGITSSSRSQLSFLSNSKMSDISGAGSLRSKGSLMRSLSFPDMNSLADHDAWKAIMEGDESFLSGEYPRSVLSSSSSGHSGERMSALAQQQQQPLRDRANTNTSTMSASLASMSIGSNGQNNINNAQDPLWMAQMSYHDDGRSILSGSILSGDMSTDMDALDLASLR